jgi:hypothetical protein
MYALWVLKERTIFWNREFGMRITARYLMSLCVCTLGILGCAEDDDFDGGGITQVVEIVADNSSIPLGEGSVIRVNFLFDEFDVLDDGGQVNLVVKLPRQLSYLDNSAEIDKPGSRDRDVDPRVRKCPNGDSYLLFDLGESQLEGAESPYDGGDAQLKFTVDGERRGEMISIQAAADESAVPYSCSREFLFDEQEIVSVE